MTTLVMTGATRGLGRVAAEELLRNDPGLHLYVIARGESLDHPRVTTIRADLASLADIRAAAARIPVPVDGYIGNAGVQMTSARTVTADGFETTFGVNVIAHYLLVRLLRFKPGARIVLTGSDSHFGKLRYNRGIVPAPRWTAPATLARPSAMPGRGAYSTSKLGLTYLVHELARRLPEVDVYTFNPALTPRDRAGPRGPDRQLAVAPGVPAAAGGEHGGAGGSAAGAGGDGCPAGRVGGVHRPRPGDAVVGGVLLAGPRAGAVVGAEHDGTDAGHGVNQAATALRISGPFASAAPAASAGSGRDR